MCLCNVFLAFDSGFLDAASDSESFDLRSTGKIDTEDVRQTILDNAIRVIYFIYVGHSVVGHVSESANILYNIAHSSPEVSKNPQIYQILAVAAVSRYYAQTNEFERAIELIHILWQDNQPAKDYLKRFNPSGHIEPVALVGIGAPWSVASMLVVVHLLESLVRCTVSAWREQHLRSSSTITQADCDHVFRADGGARGGLLGVWTAKVLEAARGARRGARFLAVDVEFAEFVLNAAREAYRPHSFADLRVSRFQPSKSRLASISNKARVYRRIWWVGRIAAQTAHMFGTTAQLEAERRAVEEELGCVFDIIQVEPREGQVHPI
ncbi:hypothetical protein HK405_012015 [Cladochytrium tenue]|nr:hypothetical protein HK405_012015 [Cladochytrium tenue]